MSNNSQKMVPINQESEPEHEPNTDPDTGQYQPDIQDEKAKKKITNRPRSGKDKINPAEEPQNDSREYHDGEPVEEKSPVIQKNL
jgi:hypothetical protein